MSSLYVYTELSINTVHVPPSVWLGKVEELTFSSLKIVSIFAVTKD